MEEPSKFNYTYFHPADTGKAGASSTTAPTHGWVGVQSPGQGKKYGVGSMSDWNSARNSWAKIEPAPAPKGQNLQGNYNKTQSGAWSTWEGEKNTLTTQKAAADAEAATKLAAKQSAETEKRSKSIAAKGAETDWSTAKAAMDAAMKNLNDAQKKQAQQWAKSTFGFTGGGGGAGAGGGAGFGTGKAAGKGKGKKGKKKRT